MDCKSTMGGVSMDDEGSAVEVGVVVGDCNPIRRAASARSPKLDSFGSNNDGTDMIGGALTSASL